NGTANECVLQPLREFIHSWKSDAYQFENQTLEKLRLKFYNASQEFLTALAMPKNPHHWELENELQTFGVKAFQAHQELVRIQTRQSRLASFLMRQPQTVTECS